MCAFPIGELARRGDTPVATIRFYEARGLLPEPARTTSGRRAYGVDDVRRLDFIRSRRALGFSLDDIATALRPGKDCAPNLTLARAHLGRVERQIARLRQVARDLQSQIAGCENSCSTGAPGAGSSCLILPS